MVASSSSSPSPFFGSREGDPTNHPYLSQLQSLPQLQPQIQHSMAAVPSSNSPTPQPQQKRKRNLPGAPSKYPDAEVIALSPKTLMATNRFICEVCNKGFQREQNLQLHRRGHNLPWKLRQKNNKEPVRRKVYLCPEPSCVHHDPARALGDLTGIKKHFSRKHGEKRFKCDKCSKRYAVQSDWKAHSKTCGTREYRCDCGTLFSRRDSFMTHRAFCDALAQESARHPASLTTLGTHLFGPTTTTTNNTNGLGLSQLPSLSNQPTADILRLGATSHPTHLDHLFSTNSFRPLLPSAAANFYLSDHPSSQGGGSGGGGGEGEEGIFSNKLFHGQGHGQLPELPSGSPSPNFNLGYFTNDDVSNSTNNSSGFLGGPPMDRSVYTTSGAHMSATALLQKAAQMGSTTYPNAATSAASILKGFPPSSPKQPPLPLPILPPLTTGFGGLFMDQNENSTNLHDLMNSLNGNDGSWAGSGPLGDSNHTSTQQSGGFNPNPNPNKLTRDFLGVGEIVRSMSGGSHHHHVNNNIITTNSQAGTAGVGGGGGLQ